MFCSEDIVTFQLTSYIHFLNPARPRRDGVKDDYYVQEIDLSCFFYFGAGPGSYERSKE